MADVIVKVEYDFKLKVTETLDVGVDGVTNLDHTLQIAGSSGSLSPTSTVPATKAWKDQGALTAGAATIDLTALARDNLPTIDMTGLKVQLVHIVNASTNSAALTVVDGASNGYNLFGDASGQVTIPVGGQLLWFGNENLDAVATADAEIDLSSSDTDATYDILIVAG